MRQAGIIPDAKLAERFANYLVTKQISGRIEPTEHGCIIWVLDDRHWHQSREELSEFLADPDAERYHQAQAPAVEIRRQQRRAEQGYRRNVVDVRRRWRSWTEGRFPLTWGLIGMSVVLSLATDYGHSAWAHHWLYPAPMITTAQGRVTWIPSLGLQDVWHGQLWRLVAPIFLNVGGPWHLLLNMYWTYQFGALIETRRGSLRLLGVVLVTAICSTLAQYFYSGPYGGGMSGVGYGMFGYIWMKSRFDSSAGIYISPNLVIMFLVWLVLCYTGALNSLTGPVGNAAHTVGLVTGILLGYAPVLWQRIVRGASL